MRQVKSERAPQRLQITGECVKKKEGKKKRKMITHTHSHQVRGAEVGQKQLRYSFKKEKQETGASAHARQK